MIIETICNSFFLLVEVMISFSVPTSFGPAGWLIDFSALIGMGLMFFPIDVWAMCIGSIVMWTTVQFVVAILKFLINISPSGSSW